MPGPPPDFTRKWGIDPTRVRADGAVWSDQMGDGGGWMAPATVQQYLTGRGGAYTGNLDTYLGTAPGGTALTSMGAANANLAAQMPVLPSGATGRTRMDTMSMTPLGAQEAQTPEQPAGEVPPIDLGNGTAWDPTSGNIIEIGSNMPVGWSGTNPLGAEQPDQRMPGAPEAAGPRHPLQPRFTNDPNNPGWKYSGDPAIEANWTQMTPEEAFFQVYQSQIAAGAAHQAAIDEANRAAQQRNAEIAQMNAETARYSAETGRTSAENTRSYQQGLLGVQTTANDIAQRRLDMEREAQLAALRANPRNFVEALMRGAYGAPQTPEQAAATVQGTPFYQSLMAKANGMPEGQSAGNPIFPFLAGRAVDPRQGLAWNQNGSANQGLASSFASFNGQDPASFWGDFSAALPKGQLFGLPTVR